MFKEQLYHLTILEAVVLYPLLPLSILSFYLYVSVHKWVSWIYVCVNPSAQDSKYLNADPCNGQYGLFEF